MIEREQDIKEQGKKAARRAPLVVAVTLALAAAGALGLIARAERPAGGVAEAAQAKAERVVIGIEGMHCGGCASGVKAMLKRTPGVISAEVSYEEKRAEVEFDPSATTREKLVEAVNNMGYKASVKG